MYAFLRNKDKPCWYELSWQKHPQTSEVWIIIKIHEEVIKSISPMSERHISISSAMQNKNIRSFNGNLNDKSFGFNDMFQRVNSSNNFQNFRIKLPSNRTEINIASFNLGILLDYLTYFDRNMDKNISCDLPQLLTVELPNALGIDRRFVRGSYSPVLCQALKNIHENTNKEERMLLAGIRNAINSALSAMDQQFYPSIIGAKASLGKNAHLIIEHNSDSGIYPDGHSSSQGYHFSSGSNLNSTSSELAIMAGLAQLTQYAKHTTYITSFLKTKTRAT